jgi:hypothetical protein
MHGFDAGDRQLIILVRQLNLDRAVGDLFGRHIVKRSKITRDQRAQVLAQL